MDSFAIIIRMEGGENPGKHFVIPAEAGIQYLELFWIPVFTGMTSSCRIHVCYVNCRIS